MEDKTKGALAAAGALGAGMAYKKLRDKKKREKYGLGKKHGSWVKDKDKRGHTREYVDDVLAHSHHIRGLKKDK